MHAYHVITHDGNGNPVDVIKSLAQPLELQMSASSIDYTFNPKKNRLQAAGGASFTYDAEGQLATGYGMSFDFDHTHRLKRVTSGELVFMEYFYDAGGNRLQTIRDGLHVTRYVYDASGNLIAETDGNNNVLRYYIYGAGLVAMATADGEFHSYHYDYTGNTMALADESGNIVNRYAYDPFGFNTASTEGVAQPFTYVGRYGVMKDPTGFYYMRARFYDPQVGRFISEDPLVFAGGDVNLFAYAKNNPISFSDPSGLAYSPVGEHGSTWSSIPTNNGPRYEVTDWGRYAWGASDVFFGTMKVLTPFGLAAGAYLASGPTGAAAVFFTTSTAYITAGGLMIKSGESMMRNSVRRVDTEGDGPQGSTPDAAGSNSGSCGT